MCLWVEPFTHETISKWNPQSIGRSGVSAREDSGLIMMSMKTLGPGGRMIVLNEHRLDVIDVLRLHVD